MECATGRCKCGEHDREMIRDSAVALAALVTRLEARLESAERVVEAAKEADECYGEDGNDNHPGLKRALAAHSAAKDKLWT